MQSIATSLTNVTQIWSTIVASLTNIGAFYTILGGPAGPNIWGVIEPKVIENVSGTCFWTKPRRSDGFTANSGNLLKMLVLPISISCLLVKVICNSVDLFNNETMYLLVFQCK